MMYKAMVRNKKGHQIGKPSWLGSKEGITDKVLPPWTPIKIRRQGDTLMINPWGRSYEFGGLPFPTQIETKGASILRRPIEVKAKVDGKGVIWKKVFLRLTKKTQAKVSFHQRASGNDLTLFGRTQVEYDGMVRVEWELKPQRLLQLEELTFEICMPAQYAKYLYHFPGKWGSAYNAGELPAQGFVAEFRPFIWLGDEERGLAWFSESDENLFNSNPNQVTEITRVGNEVTLRLRLVNIPIQLNPEGGRGKTRLAYAFGLQATPVKPVTKDVWDYRITHVSQGTFGAETRLNIKDETLDRLKELGVKTLVFHEHWTDIEGYTSTTYGDDLRKLVKACHERGIQLLLYFGFLISDLAPEWPLLGDDCIVLPKRGYFPYNYPPQPVQNAYIVCYRSIWQDFLAEGIARLMDEYDIDGVYLDGTEYPWPCENRRHGCGYKKPDGSIGKTYSIFDTREMMKRIYTIVKTRKPEGQVNVHNSTCMTIPTLAWATSYWDGEQFGGISPGPFALEVIPLDAFRTEFMGHQWGVPAEFLCYDKPFTYREAYAFTLLHDVLVRGAGLSPSLELESALWRLSDEIGRKECEWLPYWRNSDYVRVNPEGSYVSLYKHPKNGVLAVISNLSREEAELEVDFNLDRLGLTEKNISVEDGLTGEPLAMEAGRIKFTLPSLGWKMIRLNPKKE
ncbi:MAG: DUF6067 family protein [Candidatus Bathyarchaeia archaeon]